MPPSCNPPSLKEILDLVGMEVRAEDTVECIENPGSLIEYIVKIGNFEYHKDTKEIIKAAENHITISS